MPRRDKPAIHAAPKRGKRLPSVRTIAEPAKILEGHVQDTRAAVRGRYRQTRTDHLRQYADAGQIDEAMLKAAQWYEERFRAVFERSGRDSTDLNAGGGSTGSKTPLNQYQALCLREIMAVDSRLSFTNRRIIRGICGEGHHATECIRAVTGEHSRHFPIPRFREALTKLIGAIDGARFNKWTTLLNPVN